MVLLIIGRDAALVLSAFLIRWKSLPEPKTFARYWDPRLPSAKVQPTQVSKYNTFLQIVLVGICTLLAAMSEASRQWWAERQGLWSDSSEAEAGSAGEPGKKQSSGDSNADRWGDLAKKAWHAFMLLVSATTLWSGASYLSGTGATRIVSSRMRGGMVKSKGSAAPPPSS